MTLLPITSCLIVDRFFTIIHLTHGETPWDRDVFAIGTSVGSAIIVVGFTNALLGLDRDKGAVMYRAHERIAFHGVTQIKTK